MHWIFLTVAIVSEVIGTSALKASEGFSRLWPSTIVIVGYAAAFYFLSLTLKTLPVGVAYAIWSGVGIVLIALIAWVLYGQALDLPAIIGMFAHCGVASLFSIYFPRPSLTHEPPNPSISPDLRKKPRSPVNYKRWIVKTR